MIVATMASVITSATAFVSTISTASVSRPRPLAATNRESFNLLTATTRLTRSSLQSVRNQVGCSSVRTWSSRHAPDWGWQLHRATSARFDSEDGRQRGCDPAHVLVRVRKRHCAVTILPFRSFLARTGERCTAPLCSSSQGSRGSCTTMNIGSRCSPLELFPGMVSSGCLTAGSARRYLDDAADRRLPERQRLRPTPARLVSVAFLARP